MVYKGTMNRLTMFDLALAGLMIVIWLGVAVRIVLTQEIRIEDILTTLVSITILGYIFTVSPDGYGL